MQVDEAAERCLLSIIYLEGADVAGRSDREEVLYLPGTDDFGKVSKCRLITSRKGISCVLFNCGVAGSWGRGDGSAMLELFEVAKIPLIIPLISEVLPL